MLRSILSALCNLVVTPTWPMLQMANMARRSKNRIRATASFGKAVAQSRLDFTCGPDLAIRSRPTKCHRPHVVCGPDLGHGNFALWGLWLFGVVTLSLDPRWKETPRTCSLPMSPALTSNGWRGIFFASSASWTKLPPPPLLSPPLLSLSF